MCSCYILHSDTLDKFYVGATHDPVGERIKKHNKHAYGKHLFTAAASDWKLYLNIPAKDYAHAVRIERKIKSMKSSKYIRNLKKYPELVEKIVQSTST